MKKPTILFIQGGGEGAYEVDHELVSYLALTLGNGYKIVYPMMPGENDPKYELWKIAIEKELNKIDGKIILSGHSVGSFLLLKYLFENKVDENIAAAFFISTPFIGEGGWQFETMALKEESFLKPPPVPLFFYHSTDDKTVPFSHLSLYEKKLPHAAIRKIAGRGHQLNNDLSEVVHDIKTLIGV